MDNHNNTNQSFAKPQTSEHRNNNDRSLWISTFINTYYFAEMHRYLLFCQDVHR